jgi:very-short-patch-repair endonuclease
MDKHKPIRAASNIRTRARELRQQATPAEKTLWEELRNRRLGGLKFRRQHPLGPFIVDFYCPEHRLVIEIDGDIHDFQEEEDNARTRRLEDFNYRLIRFWNQEVEQNLQGVLKTILENCNPPSPRIGRRAGDAGL